MIGTYWIKNCLLTRKAEYSFLLYSMISESLYSTMILLYLFISLYNSIYYYDM